MWTQEVVPEGIRVARPKQNGLQNQPWPTRITPRRGVQARRSKDFLAREPERPPLISSLTMKLEKPEEVRESREKARMTRTNLNKQIHSAEGPLFIFVLIDDTPGANA